jgi:uncharacterized protein
MAISSKSLVVKKSTIPGSGNGLFTKKFIAKGTRILEYKGRISTWKEANHEDGANGYIYYVKRTHVIDAKPYKSALARYANDARGLTRVKGIINNCEYVEEGVNVYIHAKRDINAGEELLVPYGAEYWQVIRYNIKLEEKPNDKPSKATKKGKKKAGKNSTKKTGKKTSKKTAK